MKTFLNIIFAITALGAVFVMAYNSYSYLALRKQEIANEARFQCGQISRYQTTDANGAIVWYSVKEIYNQCLKEKGL